MPFSDFKQRYSILAASAIPTGFVDAKVASEKLVEALQLDENEFRIGHTKVFFRSGIVGELEDLRDERLSKILSQFQAYCKGNLQRNLRKHLGLKDWSWWKLWGEVRPMLALAADEAKAEEDAKAAAELGNKVTEMLAEKDKML